MQLTPPAAPPPATHVPSVQLLHGDCLDVMPTLEGQSVHMVAADLPFGCTANAWDIKIDLESFWHESWRILQKDGAAVMHCMQPFTSLLITSQLKHFRYEIIWQKSRPTGFFNAKHRPLRAHENVCIFSKTKSTYNPQMREGQKARGERKRIGSTKNWGETRGATMLANEGVHYPITVVPIATEVRTTNVRHPTQKPVALLEWLILTYTNQGDTVFDPCFGSCTTGVASLRTGRNFIGIEKDLGYFEVGRQRVAAEQARLGHPITV